MPYNIDSMSRRNVLRTTGAAIAGSVAVSSVAAAGAPATEDYADEGFVFDQVINMVEDAGADPTGEEDISPLLVEYLEDGNLLYFPTGEYKLTQFRNNEGDWHEFNAGGYYALNNIGIVGDGSAHTSFVWPEGTGWTGETGFSWEKLGFEIRFGTNHLFEGIRLDNTAPNTGARFQILSHDGLVVRDVHVDGTFESDMTCFAFLVYTEGGEGLLENVRAPDGAINEWSAPAGSVGMYIPRGHRGTLTLRNCHLEGFQDNGLYASSPSDPAAIQVEGGYFANCNISQVRLGQSNSYVKNATIVVDELIDTEYTINMRGIRQQDGEGMLVKNCNVIFTADVPSSGAIVTEARTGGMTVKNTRIHVADPATIPAVATRTPLVPTETEAVTIKNVHITGDGSDGQAVLLIDRAGNELENVCIDEEVRDGVELIRSEASIRNTQIDVGGEAIVADDDSTVVTHNLREEGDCAEPTVPGRWS